MPTTSQNELTAPNRALKACLLPASLLAVCLMGLMAVAKGSTFDPKSNHPLQCSETLNKKHVVHTPTLVLREPLPLAGGRVPVPHVTFATRIGFVEARLSAEVGLTSSIRDRSPPPSLS
jgi:hypothetical protein